MVLVTPAPASDEQIGPDGKTTKITTIESKKAGNGAERRLVEYFVVISSVPKKAENSFGQDKEQNTDSTRNVHATAPTEWKVNIAFEREDEEYVGSYDIQPIITARYPVQDHRDNPLHENVTFFCHPSGEIRLFMEPNMPKVGSRSVTITLVIGVISHSNLSLYVL
jgi:hypothetical protein